MRILVVCGAGASSTFVAQRLRTAAQNAGLLWTCTAGSESSLTKTNDIDLLLVGPHLAERLDSIVASVPAQTHVATLPSDVFEDRDGSRTLSWVRDLFDTSTAKGTPS